MAYFNESKKLLGTTKLKIKNKIKMTKGKPNPTFLFVTSPQKKKEIKKKKSIVRLHMTKYIYL